MAAASPLQALSGLFPLTQPVPTPLTHPYLVPLSELGLELDLIRSGSANFSRWVHHIANVTAGVNASEKAARGTASEQELALLGAKLATKNGREGLQRLTDIYERALAQFPGSYKLWKGYLDMRCSYVLGTPKRKLNLRAPKKKRVEAANDEGQGNETSYLFLKYLKEGRKDPETGEVGEELSDAEVDVDAQWEGGLDGVVGASEWRALAGTFERALMWLPRMPRVWLNYLNIFLHPSCPSFLLHSHARRTFDRALRVLAKPQHERVWRMYLKYAQDIAVPAVSASIFRRFLKVDSTLTEHYVQLLMAGKPGGTTRPLEAAKLLLRLSRLAVDGKYKSPNGKSPYMLLIDWLEIAEAYPEEVGITDEEAQALMEQRALRAQREEAELSKRAADKEAAEAERAAQGDANGDQEEQSSTTADGLIRFRGGPKPAEPSDGQKRADARTAGAEASRREAEEYIDPVDPKQLDVEDLIRRDGLGVYKDQAGRLWTGLATYWIKRGEFDKARQIFEEGIASVLTVRDFTQIFDAYAEFYESSISALMDAVADEEEGSEEAKETEAELDTQMKDFEDLMDRRPFLVNEVLLRRNPNDVQEWEKRVALWGTNDEEIQNTYENAINTINPRKAIGGLHKLYITYAKFFEEGGSAADPADRAERDLPSARKIFEKAIKVNFKKVDDLAEVWCEWAEMEVRNENYDDAIRTMQRATSTPGQRKPNTVDFHDDNTPSQVRLFKSLKLWSFYVDLEESIGSVETTKKVYDRIFELKIANAQVVTNYANFLEENQYFEESFKVYERGIALFGYPIAFELWNIFLARFLKRYQGTKVERTRDLFEQALLDCPAKFAKPLYLMYGQFEEDFGLARRAMNVYNRATEAVESPDRFEMFEVLVAKTTANFGLPATRTVYEKAIEVLPDKQTAEMCLRFAALERKLGEIDRARAIYAHGSQFCDPRVNPKYWSDWNAFEIETGSEDTFREMLRIKRAVQASFNTSTGYLAARAAAASKNAGSAAAASAADTANATTGAPLDAMAALEAGGAQGAAGKPAMSFVPAKDRIKAAQEEQAKAAQAKAVAEGANTEEIAIDDEDE